MEGRETPAETGGRVEREKELLQEIPAHAEEGRETTADIGGKGTERGRERERLPLV